ncbi:MAG: hypothetical protein HN368_16690, partial [Spirochaetales bacterium]|nr:hypothetical protein [Spirochaetales bacterium]
YRTGGDQTYTGDTSGVLIETTGDGTIDVTGGTNTINVSGGLYLDFDTVSTALRASLVTDTFYFFRGNLDMMGQTVTTTGDFAVFGSAYNPDDQDRGADPDEFEYPLKVSLSTHDPFPIAAPGPYTYNAAFTDIATYDLSGAAINVGGDFYVNGTDMPGSVVAAPWTLNISDNSVSDPLTNGPWGSPYAAAFYMTVDYSNAVGGVVMAAEGDTVDYPPAGAGAEDETSLNNQVIDASNNTGWDFTRPKIDTVETVFDNIVRVTFSEPIENSNNEISAVVGQVFTDSVGAVSVFTGTFTDLQATTSTDGAGDLQTFYLKTTNTTWNTDATGDDPGDREIVISSGVSTNRAGVARNVVPDVKFMKGVFFDASGHNLIRNYDENGKKPFYLTTDEARPVALSVAAGKEPKSNPIAVIPEYDSHNYFDLVYSEAVDVGTLAGGVTATNVRSSNVFTNTHSAGAITESGTQITVDGLFSYDDSIDTSLTNAARLQNGNPDSEAAHAYRRLNTNPHGVRLHIVGYAASAVGTNWFYPGYVSAVTEPVGASVTIPANDEITDTAGNIIDDTDTFDSGVVAGTAGTWDMDRPFIATYQVATPTLVEVSTVVSPTTGLVYRLEFHVLDNFGADDAAWDVLNHPNTSANQGIRDTSFTDRHNAFDIGRLSDTTLTNAYNVSVTTEVDNPLFGGAPINIINDSYFTLNISSAGHGWDAYASLQLEYSDTAGFITDLAGNLMLAAFPAVALIEREPPVIDLALVAVGSRKVYIHFTEPVFGDQAQTLDIDADDFEFLYDGTTSIAFDLTRGIEVISRQESGGVVDGAIDAFIYLVDDLTEDQAVNGIIAPKDNQIFDIIRNSMIFTDQQRRITDVGIGVVEPIWASDGFHDDTAFGGVSAALRDFDGTGRLLDQDITLEAGINASTAENGALTLYYDIDPPDEPTGIYGDFWTPLFISSELNEFYAINYQSRILQSFRAQAATRTYLIPSTDSEIEPGKTIEFVFALGDLICARIIDPEDPRSLAPWFIPIDQITAQRSGVTILNNQINPTLGEETILKFALASRSQVTVQVFNLAGDLIDVIYRGPLAAGEYTYSWNGTNRSDEVVARGLYLIRVVSSEFDEYRKVLVVK